MKIVAGILLTGLCLAASGQTNGTATNVTVISTNKSRDRAEPAQMTPQQQLAVVTNQLAACRAAIVRANKEREDLREEIFLRRKANQITDAQANNAHQIAEKKLTATLQPLNRRINELELREFEIRKRYGINKSKP